MPAREVGHNNLPRCLRLLQDTLSPRLLLSPQLRKERGARLDRLWAISNLAVSIRGVVLGAAKVVLGVFRRLLGVDKVGVKHDIVHREVQVGVLNALAPVRCRQPPARAGPGVSNLLVPAVVENTAAPIMIAKHTQPRLVAQASTLVDPLEDLVELVVSRVGDLAHGRAAVLLNAAPVEVVPDVEDVRRVLLRCACLECVCHQELRIIVHAVNVAAARGTGRLPVRLKACDKLLVGAQLHRMVDVPTSPGEDARAGPLAPAVGHDLWPALDWVHRSVHASPVTDGKDVHLLLAMDGNGRPSAPLVAHGSLWRPAVNVATVGAAPVRVNGLWRWRGISALEALVARWLAALARWAAAGLATWRRTEVQPLEVVLAGVLIVHPCNFLHLAEPVRRLRVILARPSGPSHGLLAVHILTRIDRSAVRGTALSIYDLLEATALERVQAA
mmetsp:Transcript_100610/g.267428  ORF Transcript_100610/g.267428 Transcript_100610/m.267428 type:complete len:444 (-) Transcript_100610:199-1530(-)